MTRKEIIALCERVRQKIARDGLGYSPLTEKQKAKFEEIKRRHAADKLSKTEDQ